MNDGLRSYSVGHLRPLDSVKLLRPLNSVGFPTESEKTFLQAVGLGRVRPDLISEFWEIYAVGLGLNPTWSNRTSTSQISSTCPMVFDFFTNSQNIQLRVQRNQSDYVGLSKFTKHPTTVGFIGFVRVRSDPSGIYQIPVQKLGFDWRRKFQSTQLDSTESDHWDHLRTPRWFG